MASKRAGTVAQLAAGLTRRRGLHGGAAQDGLDRQLLMAVERLRRMAVEGFHTAVDAPVSRRIALPLSLALSSQPMLCGALLDPYSPARRDDPVVVSSEVRQRVLSLHSFELNDLTSDIDRRAGLHMRQVRAVRWLWHQFGRSDPQDLVRRLLMGVDTTAMQASTRGGRLYIRAPRARRSQIHALYTPWLDEGDAVGGVMSSGSLGRYADGSLREALARGVGTSERETVRLLDYGLCLLTEEGHRHQVDYDVWRSSGAALLCGLSHNAQLGDRLTTPLQPDSIRWKVWLSAEDGRIRLGDVEGAFERMALRRVGLATRLVYSAWIARWWGKLDGPLTAQDLALLDMEGHLRAVLEPLLGWCQSPATAEAVAHGLSVPPAMAEAALARLHERWEGRMSRWVATPSADNPWTPAGRLLDLNIRVIAVMESLLQREALSVPHRDLFILYLAHAVAGADDLQLMPVDPDQLTLADVTARELWSAWKALVAEPDGLMTLSPR